MSAAWSVELPHVGESAAKPFRTLLKWAAVVAVAAVCVYRLTIFTPQALDSPDSLRPALFRIFDWWSHLYGTPEQMLARWKDVCSVALCVPPALALLYYLWRSERLRLPRRAATFIFSRWVFFASIAGCLLLCRFPILLLEELNPDEGEFLFAAHQLFHDPNFFHAVDCHTTGPLNVYPLMLPAIFGLSPDFASSRVIGLLAIFLTVYFLYRAFALLVPDEIARLAILPFPAAFCVFKGSELLHMSSEHIPLLLISLASYLCARILRNPHVHRKALFLIGFTACAAFFTKMQGVPVIAAIAAVAILYVRVRREARTIWRPTLLVFAGIVPLLLLNALLCWRAGVWHNFWISYVVSNWTYPGLPGTTKTNLPDFLGMLFGPEEVRFLMFAAIGLGAAYVVQKYRPSQRGEGMALLQMAAVAGVAIGAGIFLRAHLTPSYIYLAYLALAAGATYCIFRLRLLGVDRLGWFGVFALASVVSGFSVAYLPHRPFVHYLLFLILPLCVAMGWMLARQYEVALTAPHDRAQGPPALAFVSIFLILIVGYQSYVWRLPVTQSFGDVHRKPLEHISAFIRPPEGDFIRSLTSPSDQIRVWGWTARPYLASGREGEGRDTHVFYCFRQDSLRSFYIGRFLGDMQHRPPAVFIDATGPTTWFFNDPTAFRFEQFPEIARFVNTNYVHFADLYGQRYFLRRDLAKAREALFAIPLPPKTCSPGALVCLENAITLPQELPHVNMPEHALLQAEFVPVQPQMGPATVFNSEAVPNSFRGFRLVHTTADGYIFLAGTGDGWVASTEFKMPVKEPVWMTIEFNRDVINVACNGQRDELHLPRPMANSPGPVDLNSWIGSSDPFIGKMQFFQILDLKR